MTVALLVLLILGVNFTLWAAIGVLRLADDRRRAKRLPRPMRLIRLDEIAVVVPAHDEERVIKESIGSVTAVLSPAQVYVVSDASTDRTAEIARQAGVNVLELVRNRGKAGALRETIDHFALLDRYRAVTILDADSQVHPDYFRNAVRLLAEPDVVAVAGYARVAWNELRSLRPFGRVILAHRNRLYTLMQLLQRYGQTWRHVNVNYIVPGFASIYRSDALRRIDIDPSGLVIEDFNMTFEVQRKRLGRIVMSPQVIAYSQDPDTLRDYAKQVHRWSLGFWQTVRRHGVWPSRFWLAMSLFIAEFFTSSALLLAVPLVALALALPTLSGGAALDWPWFATAYGWLSPRITGWALLFGVVLPDYLLTVVVAALQRRPRMALWGLASLPMRMLDAVVSLVAVPQAWLTTSTGTWTSPRRR